MDVKIYLYQNAHWNQPLDADLDSINTLVIFFGATHSVLIKDALMDLKKTFKNSVVVGCSTAGEVFGSEVFEGSLSVAVCRFNKTQLKLAKQSIGDNSLSFASGEALAKQLKQNNLRNVLVLCEGLNLNGSTFVEGLAQHLPDDVSISGGLAGDDARFQQTWVSANFELLQNHVIAVGFYGDSFQVGFGSRGGWDVMGIDREVTKSDGNVLYELDGKPALELYKTYLGERAKDLPASGLLFPLAIKNTKEADGCTVRTILAIDEVAQSITFAGDIPQGSSVNLMHANIDRLIEGAYTAAERCMSLFEANGDVLCLAISCVGRKLVMGQRSEEEFEAILETLPNNTKQIGYYSYGEISPLLSGENALHNQTMTLTLMGEK